MDEVIVAGVYETVLNHLEQPYTTVVNNLLSLAQCNTLNRAIEEIRAELNFTPIGALSLGTGRLKAILQDELEDVTEDDINNAIVELKRQKKLLQVGRGLGRMFIVFDEAEHVVEVAGGAVDAIIAGAAEADPGQAIIDEAAPLRDDALWGNVGNIAIGQYQWDAIGNAQVQVEPVNLGDFIGVREQLGFQPVQRAVRVQYEGRFVPMQQYNIDHFLQYLHDYVGEFRILPVEEEHIVQAQIEQIDENSSLEIITDELNRLLGLFEVKMNKMQDENMMLRQATWQ